MSTTLPPSPRRISAAPRKTYAAYWKTSALVCAVLFGSALTHAQPATKPGVFIMGVDGMDPVILSRLIDEGKMPNFAKLAREGSYQKL